MTTNKTFLQDMKTKDTILHHTSDFIHQISYFRPETWNLKHETALRHLILLLFLIGGMVSAWAANYNYTFHIIALDGTEVLTRTLTKSENANIKNNFDLRSNNQLVRSPLVPLDNYTFYSDAECTSVITTFSAGGNADIYVKYTFDTTDLANCIVDLTGNTWYLVCVNGNSFSKVNSAKTGINSHGGSNIMSNYSAYTGYELWKFVGSDPYRIQIVNQQTNQYMSTSSSSTTISTTPCYYSIGQGNGSVYCLRVNGSDYYINNNVSSGSKIDDGSTVTLYEVAERSFNAVNASNEVVFTHTAKVAVKDVSSNYTTATLRNITIPNSLTRKYCSNYSFFSDAAVSTSITAYPDNSDPIYFRYDVDSDCPTKTGNYYNIKVNSNWWGTSDGNTVATNSGVQSTVQYQWLFTGDPYKFTIVNRYAGSTKPLSAATNTKNSSLSLSSSNTYKYFGFRTDYNASKLNIVLYNPDNADELLPFEYLNQDKTVSSPVSGGLNDGATVTLTAVAREFTYKLINKQGKVVISYKSSDSALGLKGYLKTPLLPLDAYHYYKTATLTDGTYSVSEGDEITALSEMGVNEVVYITYDDYDPTSCPYYTQLGKQLLLDGTGEYNYKVNSRYFGATSADATTIKNFGTSTTSETGAVWTLTGNDPYSFQIKNKLTDTYLSYASIAGTTVAGATNMTSGDSPLIGSGAINTFMLLYNRGSDSSSATPYCVVCATNIDSDAQTTYSFFGSDNIKLGTGYLSQTEQNQFNTAPTSSYFDQRPSLYTYTIISNAGKPVLTVTSNSSTLGLPNAVKSPLVESDGYTYYRQASVDGDGVYTLSDPFSAFTASDQHDMTIYVRYTYNKNSTTTSYYSSHNNHQLQLDGSVAYTFQTNQAFYGLSSATSTTFSSPLAQLTERGGYLTPVSHTGYLWRLTGNDPYAIRFENVLTGKYMSYTSFLTSGTNRTYNVTSSTTDEVSTFMFLGADNYYASVLMATNGEGGYNYFGGDNSALQANVPATNANGIYSFNWSEGCRTSLVPRPMNTHTFHIVDTSGHKAIKAEGQWYDQTTPSYEAIPEEIRSPYIADETLTFYTTATKNADGNTNDKRETFTLSGNITAPTADISDIYVSYTVNHLSEKQLDFSGTRQYYIQAYDDKFVTKLDLTNGSNWGGDYYWGSMVTAEQLAYYGNNRSAFWNLIGNDPYNVRIKGSTYWWFSQNEYGYPLRFQNEDNNYPNLGLILMPDASDASAFKLMCARYDTDDRWYYRRQSGSSTNVKDWIYTGITNDEQCVFRFLPVVHYHIINQNNVEAIDYRGPSNFSSDGTQLSVQLPVGARSPLIPATDFTIYSDAACTTQIATGTGSGTISRTAADVYVKYSTANLRSYLNLAGGSHYNIKMPLSADANPSYYYWYRSMANDAQRVALDNSINDSKKANTEYQWELSGNDPYNVRITSWTNSTTAPTGRNYLSSECVNADGRVCVYNNVTRDQESYILLPQYGQADDSGKYRLICSFNGKGSYNEPTGKNSHEWTLGWYGEGVHYNGWLHTVHFFNQPQSTVEFETDLTYHVINLSGKEALTYVPEATDESKTKVVLPDEFKSPLAKEYKYYTSLQMNYDSSTGIYSVKTGATSIAENDDIPSGINDIFVTYEYDSTAGIDLSGNTEYTLFTTATDGEHPMVGSLIRKASYGISCAVKDKMYSHPDLYLYTIKGTEKDGSYDPYDVKIKNKGWGYLYIGNSRVGEVWISGSQNQAASLMLLNGSEGNFEIMFSSSMKYLYFNNKYDDFNSSYALFCHSADNTYKHGKDVMQFDFQKPYFYYVINFAGEKAQRGLGSIYYADGTESPKLPYIITSPLIKDGGYSYYDKTQVDSVQLSNGKWKYSVKSGEQPKERLSVFTTQDIFVFYGKADVKHDLDLTGQITYNLTVHQNSASGSNYYTYYDYDGNKPHIKGNTSPSDKEKLTDSFLWRMTGDDPYDIALYNMSQPDAPMTITTTDLSNFKDIFDIVASTTNQKNRFCLVMGGKEHAYYLMAAQMQYGSGLDYLDYVFLGEFRGSDDSPKIGAQSGAESKGANSFGCYGRQIEFISTNNDELTYVIVNKKDQPALSVKASVAMGVAPSLPVALRSPFATNYTYHSSQSNSSDNIVTTTTAGATIYVYYDRDETSTDLRISNDGFYYMKVNGSYAYADSEDSVGRTNATAGTGADLLGYVWALDGNDDPYDIALRLPGMDEKGLGRSEYTRPAAARGLVPADNSYQLEVVDGDGTAAMHYALLGGNNLDGHYVLAVTLGSVASKGGTLPESELYGNMLDYVGSETDNTLTLLQSNIDNVSDAAQVEFEPYTVHYTYHVVDPQADGNGEHVILESYTYEDEIPAGVPASDYFPATLVRLGCPLDQNGYYTDAGTWPGENNMRLGFLPDIYVSYQVDESLLPFKYSTEGNPVNRMYWYNWKIKSNYICNSQNGFEQTGSQSAEDANLFAFYGDPYRTRIVNKKSGLDKYVAVGKTDDGTRADKLPNGYGTWSLVNADNVGQDRLSNEEAAGFWLFGTSNYPSEDGHATQLYLHKPGGIVEISSNGTDATARRNWFTLWGAKYHVVDMTDHVAATASSRSADITVPDEILSPALSTKRLKYSYSNERATATSANELDHDPYSFEDIYVFYTKDDIQDVTYTVNGQEKVLKLDGTKKYNFLVANNKYVNVNGENIEAATQTTTQSGATYLWTLDALCDLGGETGEVVDPYQLHITNDGDQTKKVETYVLLSGSDATHYRLLKSSETAEGTTANPYQYLTTNVADGATAAQVQFNGIPVEVEYVVIANTTHQVAIKFKVSAGGYNGEYAEGGDAPKIPELIKSPLATNFRYYSEANVTASTSSASDKDKYDTYTFDGKTELDALGYSAQIVYVDYDYDNANSTLDLNGAVKYNISLGKNYMGASPSNDSHLSNYLLTSDSEANKAKLALPEYLWKLEGLDPYHVVISNVKDNSWGNVLTNHGTFWTSYYGGTTQKEHAWPITATGVNNGVKTSFVMLAGTHPADQSFALVYSYTSGGINDAKKIYDSYHNDNREYAYIDYFVTGAVMAKGDSINNVSGTGKYEENSWVHPFTSKYFTSLTFTPNIVLPVTYHLTHQVTGKEDTKADDGVVVLSRLTLPTNWRRKYCTYSYTYYYKDGEDGDGNVIRLPLSVDDYNAEDGTHHKVEDATVLPSLYIADDDDKTRVHIYINYVADMPFNILAKTQAQIEKLATGTKALETFFDLTTYEKRMQTLGDVIAENPSAFTEYLASFSDINEVAGRASMRRCDFVYFMVMDTNDDCSSGNQYFLHRNDDGHVDWLNNDFKLYVQQRKNVNQWDYSRCAEAYRENDHDPFQEKRWLWAFAGDPYDFIVFNLSGAMKETWNELRDGVDAEYYLDHVVNYRSITSRQGTVTGYAPKIPDYDETLRPQDHYTWALADGKGNDSDNSFSLMTGHTDTDGNFLPSLNGTPTYWRMADGKEVTLTERSDTYNGLNFNIRLLPYEPKKYEDVRLLVRRDDEVSAYTAAYPTKLDEQTDATIKAAQFDYLDNKMKTGTARMYFSTEDRMFVAGDVIKASDPESIPLEVRRAFCDYTLYADDYRTPDVDYTVVVGPVRGTQKISDGSAVFDDSGRPVYVYYDSNHNVVEPQTVYAKYEVNSDIFLKTRPTKEQMQEMKANNDHVYFMDFPDPKMLNGQLEAYNTGHHAYFDETATFQDQVGKLYSGEVEKMVWNGSAFVGDQNQTYNFCQYKTISNRMETVPQDLKWYFVGDPYAVQVYNTNSAFENDEASCTNAANLARFDPTESRFQFVVDCVHLRLPDTSIIDQRDSVEYTDQTGKVLGKVLNNNHNKPYYDNFYWEMVPSATDVQGGFALRFRADNQLLGYRNVYYYLAHDGLSRIYNQTTETNRRGSYNINLNYRTHNERHLSGKYIGYHEANNDTTVIRLIQPAKVYFSAYSDAGGDHATFSDANLKVKEELSEYFGVGETLYEVPRHLQRKYVKYCKLGYQKNNNATWFDAAFPVVLDATKTATFNTTGRSVGAYNMETCSTHASDVFVTGAKTRASYKFRVLYDVDDLTNTDDGKQVHLFTDPSAFAAGTEPQWLDVMVSGNRNWMYYDKMKRDGNDVENRTSLVSDYPEGNKDKGHSGWEAGLKGLHWGFIGDPYSFTMLNRRRWEDSGRPYTAEQLTANSSDIWLGTGYGRNKVAETVNDVKANYYYNYAQLGNTNANGTYGTFGTTEAAGSGANGNTTWSLQLCKTGATNRDAGLTASSESEFFLRTASLKTTSPDASLVGDYSNDETDASGNLKNMTNAYERIVRKDLYSDGTASKVADFVTLPFSLDTKASQIQKLIIRTAVAKDEDEADNDCFDTEVRIYSSSGVQRIRRTDMEIKYGKASEVLPYSLRRYGCTYDYCYLVTLNADGTQKDSVRVTDFDSETFREFIASRPDASSYHLSYIYNVEDGTSQFFTTASDAMTDDYTWMNTYFAWDQKYSGTNVEVEYYEKVFSHYVYSTDGHIIDEVYNIVRRTRIESNPTTSYPTTAFLNSHTSQTKAYADEGTQSESDRQKWALVGDPYDFQMKNYALYLINNGTALTRNGNNIVSSNIASEAKNFAITVDKNGNAYLALIDENGEPVTSISFTYDSGSEKNLLTVGSGTNLNDPTGNTLDTDNVKPFKLANLIRYADILQYHLVIAHQHSLDPSETYLQNLRTANSTVVDGLSADDATKAVYNANRDTLRNHLVEYLKYQEIRKNLTGAAKYLNGDSNTPGEGTLWQESREDAIKTLLRENGTLRDFISYPIEDYSVSRVGIGNHPQVPWYMKRQFCRYYLYQRDVLRSEVDYDNPALEEADAEWIAAGRTTVRYNGKTYKVDPSAKFTHKVTIGDQDYEIVQRTFVEDGETKAAYNIKWVSVFDMDSWGEWKSDDETESKSDQDLADRKVTVDGNDMKAPKYYKQALALQGKVLDKLQDCHYNRMVLIDVVYEVIPEEFQFASLGRNTTAWYQMSTSNPADGLMNFSYLRGIGARTNRAEHYTNDYLWAPEGDPYGFVLRSRYATINGNGWDNVAVTTKGHLPKSSTDATPVGDLYARYTDQTQFDDRRIIHKLIGVDGATTDGPSNAVYEMFTGDAAYGQSFLMHPTSAYLDNEDSQFESYYMVHDPSSDNTLLRKTSGRTLQTDADANWHLSATVEQLWPYFSHSGYVGGLNPSAIKNSFVYQDYGNQLETAVRNGTQLDFATLRKIQELVYAGTFSTRGGTTLSYTDPRPGSGRPGALAADELPLTFTPSNLVGMSRGYYRMAGFSQQRLSDAEGNAEGNTGVKGPRYVSGYRFASEVTHAKPLRFFETVQDSATIHTFADLTAKKGFSDATPGAAVLQGNIELLPVDYDASSIFRFTGDKTNGVVRYTLSSQGVNVQVADGATKMSDTGTKLRLEDVGGAAVTLRSFDSEPAGDWDTEVVNTIKTKYLTSSGDSYSVGVGTENEMNQTETTEIQDTKWRLQPVGIHEEWPYNELPLRVEVQQGGTDRTGAEDKHYYGSMYVPFDTRLGNTTDAAFTLTGNVTTDMDGTLTDPGHVTMASVSQLNNMGNPLFVPAAWPVVLRTKNSTNHIVMKNQPVGEAKATTYADRHYVNLYIPNVTPTVIPNTISGEEPAIKLSGQYLEKTLTAGDLGVDDASKRIIMAFGLPFSPVATHDSPDATHDGNHEYDTSKQVGFFTNDNWARENYPTYKPHSSSSVSGEVATHAQRNNKYVYHNKIYYVFAKDYVAPTDPSSPVKYSIAVFDEEEEPREDEPIDESVGKKRVPWPCDVYDVQGRRVAKHETPQTLLKNNPSLPKGVYIFGGRKVVVK